MRKQHTPLKIRYLHLHADTFEDRMESGNDQWEDKERPQARDKP